MVNLLPAFVFCVWSRGGPCMGQASVAVCQVHPIPVQEHRPCSKLQRPAFPCCSVSNTQRECVTGCFFQLNVMVKVFYNYTHTLTHKHKHRKTHAYIQTDTHRQTHRHTDRHRYVNTHTAQQEHLTTVCFIRLISAVISEVTHSVAFNAHRVVAGEHNLRT